MKISLTLISHLYAAVLYKINLDDVPATTMERKHGMLAFVQVFIDIGKALPGDANVSIRDLVPFGLKERNAILHSCRIMESFSGVLCKERYTFNRQSMRMVSLTHSESGSVMTLIFI